MSLSMPNSESRSTLYSSFSLLESDLASAEFSSETLISAQLESGSEIEFSSFLT